MDLNGVQYEPGLDEGHYESFYQRANHPTKPWAFWIRYTIFVPKGKPDAGIGELWAIFFDGETGEHVVAKEEHPLADCVFGQGTFGGEVGESVLTARAGDKVLGPGRLKGSCKDAMSWSLSFQGEQPPLYLLPQRLYAGGFPKAKSLVGLPLASYTGEIVVNGRAIEVRDWVGSQNHNWGSRHTDHYAFGQVAGFDNAPGSFLEIVTAQAKIGPIRTPFLTFLSLRHGGVDHSLVSLREAIRARGRFEYFSWDFRSEGSDVRVEGRISAHREDFVGLQYYNPPGGIKHCLNTKIGSCELTLTDKATGSREVLSTGRRALFEILTDDRSHGVPIRA